MLLVCVEKWRNGVKAKHYILTDPMMNHYRVDSVLYVDGEYNVASFRIGSVNGVERQFN